MKTRDASSVRNWSKNRNGWKFASDARKDGASCPCPLRLESCGPCRRYGSCCQGKRSMRVSPQGVMRFRPPKHRGRILRPCLLYAHSL